MSQLTSVAGVAGLVNADAPAWAMILAVALLFVLAWLADRMESED